MKGVAMHGESLNKMAVSATLHCLLGCAIGEVLGMVIGTSLGFSNLTTIVLSVLLAFLFGYSLSLRPLVRAHVPLKAAMVTVLAADTLSIAVMELVDNAVMAAVPGAMDVGPGSALFWLSMAAALALAFIVAVPVNRWLLARGKGHALTHKFHHHE